MKFRGYMQTQPSTYLPWEHCHLPFLISDRAVYREKPPLRLYYLGHTPLGLLVLCIQPEELLEFYVILKTRHSQFRRMNTQLTLEENYLYCGVLGSPKINNLKCKILLSHFLAIVSMLTHLYFFFSFLIKFRFNLRYVIFFYELQYVSDEYNKLLIICIGIDIYIYMHVCLLITETHVTSV